MSTYIKSNYENTSALSLLDYVFIFGIVLAPIQDLRIWKFGPGEILLIGWMIAVFFGRNPSSVYPSGTLAISDIGKYQIANVCMMMIGMFVNTIIYHATLNIVVIATDLFSHLFMFFLSSCIVLYFEERDLKDINSIIQRIVVYGMVIYGFLWVYATYINTSIFGKKLWLGGRGYRFLGLGSNPHQIGMITGVGVCFSLYIASIKQELKDKVLFVLVAGIWLLLSFSLRSDTLTLTYVFLAATTVLLKTLKKNTGIETKRSNNAIIVVFTIILIILNLPRLWGALNGFIMEAGNGLGRIELWETGLGQFSDKLLCFFTGLGPGAGTGTYMRLSGNEIEAHNTYIQQILNSGIFICLYYIFMVLKIIKNPTSKNTFLVAGVLYFILYGFGGNMNRRVLVWFTFTMVVILIQKTERTEIANK